MQFAEMKAVNYVLLGLDIPFAFPANNQHTNSHQKAHLRTGFRLVLTVLWRTGIW
jgi:hypothetical protein